MARVFCGRVIIQLRSLEATKSAGISNSLAVALEQEICYTLLGIKISKTKKLYPTRYISAFLIKFIPERV